MQDRLWCCLFISPSCVVVIVMVGVDIQQHTLLWMITLIIYLPDYRRTNSEDIIPETL